MKVLVGWVGYIRYSVRKLLEAACYIVKSSKENQLICSVLTFMQRLKRQFFLCSNASARTLTWGTFIADGTTRFQKVIKKVNKVLNLLRQALG